LTIDLAKDSFFSEKDKHSNLIIIYTFVLQHKTIDYEITSDI